MALPVVQTLGDCSDWSLTVSPYIGQIYNLPQQLLQSWNNPTELRALYLATNPLISAFMFALALAPLVLVVSEFNKNYSQVDRLWSILPTLYNAHFVTYAHLIGLPTQRLDNLLAVSTVWSLRLTFNYFRKGGYNIGSEDYRWATLKSWVPGWAFFLFNIIFISFIQSILLFAITAPTYVLLLTSRLLPNNLSTADIICSRFLLVLITIEFFADQQQWDFQKAKKSYLETAKVPHKYNQIDLDRGFVASGLWSWSRHPNFAAEQAVWVTIYQWGCLTSDVLYNWTATAAVAYLLLFQGSTWLTELLTAGKYPEYKEYQKRVGRFLPKLSSKLPGDFSDQKAKPKAEVEKNGKGEKKKAIKR
ncbi:hypothetical protein B0O99DRAFT_571670 [Bisporella sp. PMI_857]|nr:hypothetical protein B0O99DRAFT_571670 [Bisporella sp. PMI_857]